jgi:hypothetical protein
MTASQEQAHDAPHANMKSRASYAQRIVRVTWLLPPGDAVGAARGKMSHAKGYEIGKGFTTCHD